MTHNEPATGVMLVGVYGSVALCTMIGAIARRLGKTDDTGMVSTLEEFSHLSLPEPSQWVWGGWDIRNTSLIASARELHEVTGSISSQLFESVSGELEKIEKNVFRGSGYGLRELLSRFDDIELTDRNAAQSVLQMKEDIVAFRRMNSLDRVIVVNVASTEPLFEQTDAHRSLSSLDEAISSDSEGITPSILYAYAALDSGCPYINFTPSPGTEIPALRELSDQKGLPHTGRDGKTGETLLKTVLAPMFAKRNFKVMAWQGYNMLGNRDGLILDDPDSNSAKTANKDKVLRSILPDENMHTQTRIDYVKSLDDWKVAWDYIHFKGFLGTKMSLSFQWNGCDSMLAAPLVLDLVRFVLHEYSRGNSGVQKQLAAFFKNPIDVDTADFFEQLRMLSEHYGQ